MARATRWLRLNGKQRELAANLLIGGSTTLLAYNTYRYNPQRLDSSSGTFSKIWTSRPTVLDHKKALLKDAETKPGNDEESEERKQSDETKHQPSGSQPPPPQTKGHNVFDSEGDLYADGFAAWQTATGRITSFCASLSGFDIGALGEKVTGLILPDWVRMLPRWLDKLQNELSMAPWSLSWEIWEEAHDPEINPEIVWEARVRVSPELCVEEQDFLNKRLLQTTKALAKYLDVPEADIHPDDVPIIAMCGSGGGLRALVAGASSFLSTQKAGLFDCVTYTAGVSGSCWLQALFNSSIGQQDYGKIIEHLKDRIGIHIASPPALLTSLSQAPTNKYLLSGFVEKLCGVPNADFGLVDVYGLALAARLMVPQGELRVNSYDIKVSNQRLCTDKGQAPLPIYTAVRHEIPKPGGLLDRAPHLRAKLYDSFQWFEWTPYEFYCENLEAGIPSWAVGRDWNGGETVWRDNGLALPELRIPLYLGIWGSAFCATLSHYYREVRPILRASGMSGLDSLLSGKDEDLVKVHPIDPAVIPNFALGLRNRLPASCPESIHTSTHLQLMDAGMANNLPIYPLLRPGRSVDVIITFDASADVRGDNWIKVVDNYARQRGIKGWPMGAGWPPQAHSDGKCAEEMEKTQASAQQEESSPPESSPAAIRKPGELGYCTVWTGSTHAPLEFMDEPAPTLTSSSTSPSTADNDLLTDPSAGIAVIYFPFLANPAVPAVDPTTDDFMSTWNFVYQPKEIEKVVELARANFEAGKEQTKRTIRAVWERKRGAREAREREEGEFMRRVRIRRGLRREGDHFSGV